MSQPQLPANIRQALSEVRWRIRAYVLVEGLALALVWVGLTFWLGLAFDYLPVLVWASEIPRAVRGIALAVVALVLAWILVQWVFRRTLVRLQDRSMAMLVERRFGHLHDGLLTAVELGADEGGERDGYDARLLERTTRSAEEQVSRLQMSDLFNPAPLARKAGLAAALILPIGFLYFFQPTITKTWVRRFYMLSDQAWPRNTQLEVIGLRVARRGSGQGDETPLVLPFAGERTLKVARGENGVLQVRARSRRAGREAPRYCTIYYHSADGVRSSVRMQRVGRLDDHGFQTYELASKPFEGLLEDLEFDVVADDFRLNGYSLDVVDTPEVVETRLDCEFPKYLVDEATTSWLPRTMAYLPNGTSLPQGTSVAIRMQSSKPLREVWRVVGPGQPMEPVSLESEDRFTYRVDPLAENLTLEFVLRDVDDIESSTPVKVMLGAIVDQAPGVTAQHPGIGALITTEARVPVLGQATDDYRLGKVWVDVEVAGGGSRSFPLAAAGGAKLELDGEVDFRAARSLAELPLELQVEQKLSIAVRASDRFNLGPDGRPSADPNDLAGPAHIGAAGSLEVEVVTPERLLSSLDQRELAQRRVFEHVIEELTATRDDLDRVRREATGETPASDTPLDPDGETKLDPETLKQRAEALRRLRIQQAGLQSQKSTQEVLGIAAAFEGILLEIQNNRVESGDRHQRLQDKIVNPLRSAGEVMFPELDSRLKRLEEVVADAGGAPAAAEAAVAQVDDILDELQLVLQDMLYIETYNELVETVRLILEEEAKILEETQQQRKRSALEGLLD